MAGVSMVRGPIGGGALWVGSYGWGVFMGEGTHRWGTPMGGFLWVGVLMRGGSRS